MSANTLEDTAVSAQTAGLFTTGRQKRAKQQVQVSKRGIARVNAPYLSLIGFLISFQGIPGERRSTEVQENSMLDLEADLEAEISI